MNTVTLIIILIILIFLSAFFSAAETALMAINRYRLRHLAKSGNRTAQLVSQLLERPDKTLSIILIGNTFANIMASAVATLIASRYFGDGGVFVCTVILIIVILIFAEVTPKTFATTQALRLSFFVAWPLLILKKTLYPLAWSANKLAVSMLRLIGVHVHEHHMEALNSDELRTLLHEAGHKISAHHQGMLLGILDLSHATVDDIMIPKNEIVGIDLEADWQTILRQLSMSQHTRLPVYRGSPDNVQGILHMRDAARLLTEQRLTQETLPGICREVYYVPEKTPLSTQLLNFQKLRRRCALIVDEYGDILGMITLEDILEEIVGEFTTDFASSNNKLVYPQTDGSFIVEGSANIRDLNRLMNWQLPSNGAKTLSGVIIEYLEMIPAAHTALRLEGYSMEVLQVKDNMIKTVRIISPLQNQSG